MTGRDERETALAAVAGDPEATAELWLRHRSWVAAVLLAHRPRESELDDLLQEVATAMLQGIDRLAHPQALRPWLRAIAVRVAVDHGRAASRRRRLAATAGERALPLAPSADEALARGEDEGARLTQVRAWIDELPAELREPLLLLAVRGMSQKQVAATLGLSESAVETRLVRARRALRERLARDAGRALPPLQRKP